MTVRDVTLADAGEVSFSIIELNSKTTLAVEGKPWKLKITKIFYYRHHNIISLNPALKIV